MRRGSLVTDFDLAISWLSLFAPGNQDLSFQGGISDLDADVLGLVFLPSTACLLASDSGGDVVLWVAEFDKAGAAPAGGDTKKQQTAASERLGSVSASMDEAKLEPQRDVGSRGSRSAPAWEADAKFTAAEGNDKRENGVDAANLGARRSVDRSARGAEKAGSDRSENLDQPATE